MCRTSHHIRNIGNVSYWSSFFIFTAWIIHQFQCLTDRFFIFLQIQLQFFVGTRSDGRQWLHAKSSQHGLSHASISRNHRRTATIGPATTESTVGRSYGCATVFERHTDRTITCQCIRNFTKLSPNGRITTRFDRKWLSVRNGFYHLVNGLYQTFCWLPFDQMTWTFGLNEFAKIRWKKSNLSGRWTPHSDPIQESLARRFRWFVQTTLLVFIFLSGINFV